MDLPKAIRPEELAWLLSGQARPLEPAGRA
jgi:hypothetical protein